MINILHLQPDAGVLTPSKPVYQISLRITIYFQPYGLVTVLRSKVEGCVQAAEILLNLF